MPWYYAGPDARPVGPISLEELHARRLQGAVMPETYVIEHTGQASDVLAWRRYREVFPSSPVLPPAPAASLVVPPATPPAPAFVPGAMPVTTGQPAYTLKPTNRWCAWGFGLGLTGFFFSFACGMGLLLALPSLLLCIVGLSQVAKNHAQAGKGLAVAGLILSSVAVLISLGLFLALATPVFRAHQLTVTEQTSNDSD
jgi:hypothetical protein